MHQLMTSCVTTTFSLFFISTFIQINSGIIFFILIDAYVSSHSFYDDSQSYFELAR